jgi:hypothetical protein
MESAHNAPLITFYLTKHAYNVIITAKRVKDPLFKTALHALGKKNIIFIMDFAFFVLNLLISNHLYCINV